MIRNIYAIHDRLTRDAIGGIFVFPADAAAVRFFGDVLSQEGSLPAQHPNDCELLCLGNLQTIDGPVEISVNEGPRVVTTGESIVAMWAAAKEARNG